MIGFLGGTTEVEIRMYLPKTGVVYRLIVKIP